MGTKSCDIKFRFSLFVLMLVLLTSGCAAVRSESGAQGAPAGWTAEETAYVNAVHGGIGKINSAIVFLSPDDSGSVLDMRRAINDLEQMRAPATLAVLGYYVVKMQTACSTTTTFYAEPAFQTRCNEAIERVFLQIAISIESRGAYPPTPAP